MNIQTENFEKILEIYATTKLKEADALYSMLLKWGVAKCSAINVTLQIVYNLPRENQVWIASD